MYCLFTLFTITSWTYVKRTANSIMAKSLKCKLFELELHASYTGGTTYNYVKSSQIETSRNPASRFSTGKGMS